MPGGRARGNPVQILSENCQKIPWILLKNFMFLDITIESPYTWYMNFGPAPLGWDFSIFGTQCYLSGILVHLLSEFLRKLSKIGQNGKLVYRLVAQKTPFNTYSLGYSYPLLYCNCFRMPNSCWSHTMSPHV